MRLFPPLVALVWLLPVGASKGWERVEVPKTSELRKDISFNVSDDRIRERIVQLIPLGTSEADARVLFQKHMPPKAQKKFNEGGVVVDLPKNLRGKPYTCYRLFSDYRLLASGWIEVLFFFENGKLAEVHVARGGVSA